MSRVPRLLLPLLALPLAAAVVGRAAAPPKLNAKELPAPRREFRGVWVATVDNIDWPSKPGLPVEQQKSELLAILDRAVDLRLNAVVFQVRPQCDALYDSRIEPWSEFLTGEMGRAPEPFYDPLAFVVEEAHRRGLELHAWFNPYRAHSPAGKALITNGHVSKTAPDLVRAYGTHLWLDPGLPEVQDYSLKVIRDVVRRYDVDGVHLDDYFYPYKERGPDGKLLPFPDDPSWSNYVTHGGKLKRDDWRRENVNTFVRRLYQEVRDEKAWVRVGISPFGIWRPGHPPQIKGFDAYQEIYADALKWWESGWLDYFAPQLYWRIEPPAQSYPVLLKWWAEKNGRGRHLWPGNYTGRVGSSGSNNWPAEEIASQIRLTREQPGAGGNIHFSAKTLMQNRGGVADLLRSGVYAQPALVPASPWLDRRAPGRPKLRLSANIEPPSVTWEAPGGEKPWLWLVQRRTNGAWTTEVLPAGATRRALDGADAVAVTAVDRCGNQGKPALAAAAAGR